MNRILNKILKERQGHYVHALEVETVYELEQITETLYHELKESFFHNEIIDFLSTMDIYYLAEVEIPKEEKEIYNFNIEEHIKNI